MELKDLSSVLEEEIQDLYSAEMQIIEALPMMAEKATNKKLKKGFEEHLKQTQEHVKRLEEISNELEIDLDGKMCKGMEGLLKEGEEILEMEGDPNALDAALIGAAQRVEHYEIAAYGNAVAHAKVLKQKTAEKLLKKTLGEEAQTDKKLSMIAEKEVNKDAMN